MIAKHNSDDCNFSRTDWDKRLTAIEKSYIVIDEWKEERKAGANRREKIIVGMQEEVKGMRESQIKTEGTIKLIFEKLSSVTKMFIDDKKKYDREKEFNKKLMFSLFICVLGLAVTWGGLKFQVAHNTEDCDSMRTHIKVDEARWNVYRLEDKLK